MFIEFGTKPPEVRKKAPLPRHPDWTVMFPSPLDMTFGPLAVTIVISLHRNPRMKCAACGLRRVCFHLGLGESITSPPVCAKCAGLRSQ